MKIEQLLVQFLYNHKHLYLQGIGAFHLAEHITLPAETDKDMTLPADAISFTADGKVQEDSELIDFIVQQTRKIRPLASADLDSFILLGKQFLNIGKPFRLEGIGTLHKNQQNGYDFTPGQLILPRIDINNKPAKEKSEEEHISFETPSRPKNSSQKPLLIGGAIVLAGLIGFATWYFWPKATAKAENEVGKTTPPSEAITTKDTTPVTTNNTAVPDTANTTLQTVPPPTTTAGYTFRIVLKDYTTKLAAEKAFTRLTNYGHKLLLYPKDSTGFKIAMPFNSPLSDTLRAKDSLRKFFGGSPYVQL
jgi:hypothetical protein